MSKGTERVEVVKGENGKIRTDTPGVGTQETGATTARKVLADAKAALWDLFVEHDARTPIDDGDHRGPTEH